jgi:phospholipid transport system substrate-binding protein
LEVQNDTTFFAVVGFRLFFSLIEGIPRSLAATNDPASIVSDLGSRAIAAVRNGDTAAANQKRFRELFRQYFDVEACARFALGTYWRTATAVQRQEFVALYEDYVIVGYSTALRALGGASFEILGSQSDREAVTVSSRVQINGGTAIRVNWRLDPTNHGYKVTDLLVNGISTASTQHSELVSVIQRHNGHVPSLLVAMRKKMRATASSDNRPRFPATEDQHSRTIYSGCRPRPSREQWVGQRVCVFVHSLSGVFLFETES